MEKSLVDSEGGKETHERNHREEEPVLIEWPGENDRERGGRGQRYGWRAPPGPDGANRGGHE